MESSSSIYLTIVDEFLVRKRISIEDAEILFNIKWIEWDENYSTIFDYIEIRYMSNDLGWGMFCKKKLAPDMLIGIFSGEIKYQKRSEPINSVHVFLTDYLDDQFQVVDASKSGNITRFLQHLPPEDIVNSITTDMAIANNIATANIRKEIFVHNENVLTEKYITNKEILPGEIIGCCYDPLFWSEKKPSIFYKDGSVISNHLYSWIHKDEQLPHVPRRFVY